MPVSRPLSLCAKAPAYRGRVSLVKGLMGKRTVFTRSSTERKDLDVVQVFIEMGADFAAPAGLRVDVAISVEPNAACQTTRKGG